MRGVTLWEETVAELAWREKARLAAKDAASALRHKATPASRCRKIKITDELRAKYNFRMDGHLICGGIANGRYSYPEEIYNLLDGTLGRS